MNIKRSLSYNDLSVFKQDIAKNRKDIPLNRTQSHKNIRFAGIKNICVFKSSDSPSRISSSKRYFQSSDPVWTMESNFNGFFGFFGNAVALESLLIMQNQIVGNILVKNLSYSKQVILWYTIDDWKNVLKLDCNFETSVSAGIDRFVFKIDKSTTSIHKMDFCIKYIVNNTEYWDNNHGRNYQVNLKDLKI
jgi:hypothetical protein